MIDVSYISYTQIREACTRTRTSLHTCDFDNMISCSTFVYQLNEEANLRVYARKYV